jgi:catechol 2,3-dioxygenase-like lactoylglutathione lyase family enzyme
MKVKRIVANIGTAGEQMAVARRFYAELLGLEIVMDVGWIVTFAGAGQAPPQLSIATEGGSGTPVPDFSIEVDDVDEAHRRVISAGLSPEYGPVDEPWGVRRFYIRDPLGRLLNIMAHRA